MFGLARQLSFVVAFLLATLLLWLASIWSYWQPGPYDIYLQSAYAAAVLMLFVLYIFGITGLGAFLLRVFGYERGTDSSPFFLAFLVGISVLNISGTIAARFDLLTRPVALMAVAIVCASSVFYYKKLGSEDKRSLNIPASVFWIFLIAILILRGIAPDIRGVDSASHYPQLFDYILQRGGFRTLSDATVTLFYLKGLGSSYVLTTALANPFPSQLMSCSYIAMAVGLAVHVHGAAWGGNSLFRSFVFGFILLHLIGIGRTPIELLKGHAAYGYYILTLVYLPVYLRNAPPLPRAITALVYLAAANVSVFCAVSIMIIDSIRSVLERIPLISILRRFGWQAGLIVGILILNWLLYRLPEISMLKLIVMFLGLDSVDQINNTIGFEVFHYSGVGGVGGAHINYNKMFNAILDGVAYTHSFLFSEIWFRAILGVVYLLGGIGMVGLAIQLGRERALIASVSILFTHLVSTLFADQSSILRVYWFTDILRIVFLIYGIGWLCSRVASGKWVARGATGLALMLTAVHIDYSPLKFIAGTTDSRAMYGSFLLDSCEQAKMRSSGPVISFQNVWGCYSYKDTRFLGMRFFDHLYIGYHFLLTGSRGDLWSTLRSRHLGSFFLIPGHYSNTIYLYARIFDPDTIDHYVRIAWRDNTGAVLLELKDQPDNNSSTDLPTIISALRAEDARMTSSVETYRRFVAVGRQ